VASSPSRAKRLRYGPKRGGVSAPSPRPRLLTQRGAQFVVRRQYASPGSSGGAAAQHFYFARAGTSICATLMQRGCDGGRSETKPGASRRPPGAARRASAFGRNLGVQPFAREDLDRTPGDAP
jgi:hypothetical protein